MSPNILKNCIKVLKYFQFKNKLLINNQSLIVKCRIKLGKSLKNVLETFLLNTYYRREMNGGMTSEIFVLVSF